MIKLGLTGGIGVGKSTIARIFSELGVPIYNADFRAKKFYERESIAKKVAEKFHLTLDKKHQLNLKELANVAFKNAENIQWLNELIHPLVIEDFEQWCEKTDYPYVIMESAIIYEAFLEDVFDKIILVAAPEEITMQRLIERDKTNYYEINKRKSLQWKQIDKIKKADYVIENDKEKALIPRVLEIHNELIK